MTKEEYLKLAAAQWEHLQELEKETNFYDYEKKFDGLMVNFGQQLLEGQIKGSGNDRRQKKSKDPIWKGGNE